uniref:non-specific serine/threonine protein kinase n=1 Tax=Oryza meridionalis TaxID=40149 RepID=A0A0E0DNX3_9ORYZ
MWRCCSSNRASGLLVWLVLVCSWQIAAAQPQQAAKTDPTEVAALNTILGRWSKKASSEWNISGEPCSGVASDPSNWDNFPNINPLIKCACTYNNNTVCHITKLGLALNPLSGPLPKELGNLTNLLSLGISLDNFTGELPEELGNLTKLQQLRASDNEFTGKIPDYLGSLTNLIDLILRNCKVSGNLGPVDFSMFTALILLDLSFNNITGEVPQSILNMGKLEFLFLGNNSLTGKLPDVISSSLKTIDFSYNQLTGNFPSWATQNNLQLNLVANKFDAGSTNRSKTLLVFVDLQNVFIFLFFKDCSSQHDFRNFKNNGYVFHILTDYSFAVDCGSNSSTRGSDNTIYEAEPTNLGDASYYVTGQTRWGVSNVGKFSLASNGMNIISSSEHFQNAVNSRLFETARMSPSSLRYYGLGLENGNYTVLLQFAEVAYPDSQTWQSLGRRVFDIYIQGSLREKDFDIRKMAGGKSFIVVNRSYTATVSNNFLEIHLFWAGKGTCCIPTNGYYGPMISALSVSPNFTPTVRNGVPKRRSKVHTIAGILIGASILGLAAIFGIFMMVKKRRTMAQQKEELYNLIGRPDVFSNTELRLATDNFSSQNILGEGGYGMVYKGKLSDGRVIAVKQLSQSSHQGKSQFVAEVTTISAVQHRNLVKLHGFCIDSNTPLLVYEYLQNGSLDTALFGIASGLTYLHEESSVRIVHRDIKASNILLETDLTPKISDFGLAKLYDEKQTHVSTRIAGTLGYLAPEYAMRGRLTEKVDVFAFGVVVLEIVAGRSNTNNSLEESKIYLFEWLWDLYEKEQVLGIVDPSLKDFNSNEAFRVIRVALLCTQGSPHQRPPMSKALAMLTGEVELSEVVVKPSYITEWQLRDVNRSYATSSYSGSTNPEFSTQKEIEPLTQS